MIEGGGLGVFTPDEVGPMDVQVPNGVVISKWPMKPKRWFGQTISVLFSRPG